MESYLKSYPFLSIENLRVNPTVFRPFPSWTKLYPLPFHPASRPQYEQQQSVSKCCEATTMNTATGILSSSSSTFFNYNRCHRFVISSLTSPYKTHIRSSWKRRVWRSMPMNSSPPSSSSLYSGASATKIEPAALSSVAAGLQTFKPSKQQPWLIVGLGNPGKLYNRTRHNVRTLALFSYFYY